MKTEGIKIENGIAYCEKCGADVGKEGSVKMLLHFDGAKIYGYTYECNNCGAVLKVTLNRGYNPNRYKDAAPKTAKPNAKKVIWKNEAQYDSYADECYTVILPQCPVCKNYPTYNEESCPYCGQELDYTEETK